MEVTTALFACMDKDWQRTFEAWVEHSELHVSKKHGFDLWDRSKIKKIGADVYWVDGINVRNCWTGIINGVTLAASPIRLYFCSSRPDDPIRRKESEILQGIKKPNTPQKEKVRHLNQFLNEITLSDMFVNIENDSSSFQSPLFDSTKAVGSGDFLYALKSDLWTSIKRAGIFSLKSCFTIYVVHDTASPEKTPQVNEYCKNISRKFNEINKTEYTLTIKKTSLDKALTSSEEGLKKTNRPSLQSTVFLVAITGKVGDRLPAKQARLLDSLDELDQPYRLFSYDNQNLSFSASNQIISLLQSVGGRPYRLKLPYPEDFSRGVFIGLDLGHDKINRKSNLVLSVMDSYGEYILSVKMFNQPLNESNNSEVLKKILRKAFEEASLKLDYAIEKCIILRDGLIPPKRLSSSLESIEDYLEALRVPTTIIELRKRGNPPLYLKDENNNLKIADGLKYQPRGSQVRFFNAYESKFGLSNVFKVNIPRNGENFGWDIDSYTEILCGLCYSPSLGTKPHAPGPIYWADGIAKTSETNNQFRGQYVIDYN